MLVPTHIGWDSASAGFLTRYSALKSLGEKKACFKEYQDARAKAEKDEARAAQRKAREGFVAMLEESRELKAGHRYSKAAALLDHDPRWKVLPDQFFLSYLPAEFGGQIKFSCPTFQQNLEAR